MFEQFHALKAQQPDAILFFRMGDFYETFFEDAEVAARVLELTLTSRNKSDPEPIPMAGVPHHAAASYIQRMVDAGHKVAIAEQVEDPALAKGLVRREIVRVVTPGVVLDPSALAARAVAFLVAVAAGDDGIGLAALEVSTGDLRVATLRDPGALGAELARLEPREALLGPGTSHVEPTVAAAVKAAGGVLSAAPVGAWEGGARRLEAVTGARLASLGLDGSEIGVVAAGAALAYAAEVLGKSPTNLHAVRVWRPEEALGLDETTRRNLELTRTLLGGTRKGSLLALVDRACSAMGSRMVRDWISAPLRDVASIQRRQAAVGALVDDAHARESLRRGLREVADVERILARVSQGSAHGRDLLGLRRSLEALPEALAAVASLLALAPLLPDDGCEDVAADLARWIVDDPPLTITEGGVIREGAHAALDELTELALQGRGVIARLEAREKAATGISSLKVRHNRVLGYYWEVTRAGEARIPDHFIARQQLTNVSRYVTVELKELEERVLGADERRKALEHELFLAVRARVEAAGARLAALAGAIATLDALAALAEVAVRHRWSRPEVVDEPGLAIVGGRHPVVEAARPDHPFVPNDLTLDPDRRRLIVLTGPNMAGKSTIMRQTALIVLLAQAGSFVPAASARIGLVDRIFTRVGAADDLAAGQSTFMVEMAETAAILRHATSRSLVILDEIGRGTSTYDGLSIAWAVAEDLVDRVRCLALFATHYHELCELAGARGGVVNQSVAVREHQGEIRFLHRLQEGGASRSYGIQCARLAGLPHGVVGRARQLLTHFEKHAPRNDRHQLSLFGGGAGVMPAEGPAPQAGATALRDALEAVAAIDPDALTPREALDALYLLRQRAAAALEGRGRG
jgi:DNA mismatch repair protein MutS